ncbi:hypothetical protein [Halopelagius fulvigenes]|uniref:Uncharacterized protein n=1 Tax=Halopelagius fulvigenes TaxID=1198324 RepID=A0ABD5U152_9EURY
MSSSDAPNAGEYTDSTDEALRALVKKYEGEEIGELAQSVLDGRTDDE